MQKIIVSSPAIGSHSYGLTDLGKEQAQKVLVIARIVPGRGVSNAVKFRRRQ